MLDQEISKLCSMIEALNIKDLQESKTYFLKHMNSDDRIIICYRKIFSALKKVFYEDIKDLTSKKIFINISSNMGLDLINNLELLEIPEF